MSLPAFKFLRPRSLWQAVDYLARHGSDLVILAGGTDLLPSMKQKLFTPSYVMDIRGIEEIHGIHVRPGAGVESVALRDFYTNVGDARMKMERNEMLTRVFLPEDASGWKGSYMKLRIRGSIDYPLAGVAVALKKNGGPVENARVAITAVNPAPLLVKGAENALIGKQIDEHVAILVGELAAKMAKPLTTSGLTPEYRREIVKVYAKRAVLAAGRS